MEAHQSEAVWLIGLIQPLQQKLETITQLVEVGLSEHISSDRVEQLAAHEEEVTAEFVRVQQMVKEF